MALDNLQTRPRLTVSTSCGPNKASVLGTAEFLYYVSYGLALPQKTWLCLLHRGVYPYMTVKSLSDLPEVWRQTLLLSCRLLCKQGVLASPDLAPRRHIAVGDTLVTAVDLNSESSPRVFTHVIVEARRYLEAKPIGFHSRTIGL